MLLRIYVLSVIPLVVVLLPLVEAIAFTFYWRRSLSHPWVYGVIGTLLVYAVAAGIVTIAERIIPSRNTVILSGAAVWREGAPSLPETQSPNVSSDSKPRSFEPLTAAWFGLLITVLVVCGLALWGLRFAFRSPLEP